LLCHKFGAHICSHILLATRLTRCVQDTTDSNR
jgi:hypothetical protein